MPPECIVAAVLYGHVDLFDVVAQAALDTLEAGRRAEQHDQQVLERLALAIAIGLGLGSTPGFDQVIAGDGGAAVRTRDLDGVADLGS